MEGGGREGGGRRRLSLYMTHSVERHTRLPYLGFPIRIRKYSAPQETD